MKLIIAIVHDDYVNRVVKELVNNKIRSTKLTSSGGFLKSGNTTLLIGTKEENVDKAIDVIRSQCDSKGYKDGTAICGANIFVLNADQFKKL